MLGGDLSWGNGINNMGAVVGQSMLKINTPQPYSDDYRAFLYQNGEITEVETPWNKHSYASDVNGSGQIVGWVTTNTGYANAFLSYGGNFIDLEHLVEKPV